MKTRKLIEYFNNEKINLLSEVKWGGFKTTDAHYFPDGCSLFVYYSNDWGGNHDPYKADLTCDQQTC